jgi:hypothetical protein
MREELGVTAQPLQQLWQSVTHWNVELTWWLTRLDRDAVLQPNGDEVAEILWLTPGEMRNLSTLLVSNRQFLDAWSQGDFSLPLDGGVARG